MQSRKFYKSPLIVQTDLEQLDILTVSALTGGTDDLSEWTSDWTRGNQA